MMGLEHARNIELLPEAAVTALADPHEESRKWGRVTVGPDVEVYEDYRRLLERAPVDAVVIATPNHTHADVLADVFATDKHVLVEKPLCTTLEDCRRVEEAAKRHPAVVWVGLEYRYMPPVTRMIEEVRRGAVGRPVMLAIREHRFPFLNKVGDWNRFARNTGGTLVEKCCHFFDLMHLILDAPPIRVYASGGQDVNHLDETYEGKVPDIIDNAYATVDFEGGARALLDLCMFAEQSRNREEIAVTGDRGKVECFVPASDVVIGRRAPPGVQTVHVPVDEGILRAGFHHGATYYQHQAFLEAVRSGSPPEVGVEDGLRSVAMGLAAEHSIEERRPIELSELGI
jgi:predicted dehydrogenase